MATPPALDGLSDPGGLFVRLGAIFKVIQENRTWQRVTYKTRRDNIYSQFSADTASPVIHDEHYIETLIKDLDRERDRRNALNAAMIALAKRVVRLQLDDLQGLPDNSDSTVLDRLLFQMREQSYDMDNVTPNFDGPTFIPSSPTGDGTIYPSGLNFAEGPLFPSGSTNPTLRQETVEFELIDIAGEGTFTIKGEPIVVDRASHLWPGGSGAGTRLPVVDPSVDGSGTPGPGINILTNSDFEDFTAGLPNQWTSVRGSPGVDFDADISDPYNGTSALNLIGNNNDPMIEQRLANASDGTGGSVVALKGYHIFFRYKASSDSPATIGTLDAVLTIGMLTLKKSIDMSSGAATAWTGVSHFVATPQVIPAAGSTLKFEIGLASGSNLSPGQNILIDDLSLSLAVVHGNVSYSAQRGQAKFDFGDDLILNVSNDQPVYGGSDGEFHWFMDMLYDLHRRQVVLPQSGTPNVPDSLIA